MLHAELQSPHLGAMRSLVFQIWKQRPFANAHALKVISDTLFPSVRDLKMPAAQIPPTARNSRTCGVSGPANWRILRSRAQFHRCSSNLIRWIGACRADDQAEGSPTFARQRWCVGFYGRRPISLLAERNLSGTAPRTRLYHSRL